MIRSLCHHKSLWFNVILLIACGIGWVTSMHRIDLFTWVIGPGRGGERVVQLAQANGTVSLFIGETGLFRGTGAYFESRVFDADDAPRSWLPQWMVMEIEGSGVIVYVAHWSTALIFIVATTTWIIWCRRSEKRQDHL